MFLFHCNIHECHLALLPPTNLDNDVLEKDGDGLNLTFETRMGILGHTGNRIPETLEGQIVRIADRIAYINHDIDDAMRAGILSNADIPRSVLRTLGQTHKERINSLVENIIHTSYEQVTISMEPALQQAMDELRAFMFERVYRNPIAKGQETKAKRIIEQLYTFYMGNPDKLPADFLPQLVFEAISRTICDYIAGMTDNYAVYKYQELFIPQGWQLR